MAAARVAMQGGGGGVGSPMVFSGEEGEELCRSLHDQIRQRDQLLDIVRDHASTSQPYHGDLAPRPPAVAVDPQHLPMDLRIANLQHQLAERDRLLAEAGKMADQVLVARQRSPPPASSLPSSSPAVPRPSWLSPPDPQAGAARLANAPLSPAPLPLPPSLPPPFSVMSGTQDRVPRPSWLKPQQDFEDGERERERERERESARERERERERQREEAEKAAMKEPPAHRTSQVWRRTPLAQQLPFAISRPSNTKADVPTPISLRNHTTDSVSGVPADQSLPVLLERLDAVTGTAKREAVKEDREVIDNLYRGLHEAHEELHVTQEKVATLENEKATLLTRLHQAEGDRSKAVLEVEELGKKYVETLELLTLERNKRVPPSAETLYSRDDHLRALQALQDTQAKLSRFQLTVGKLEGEIVDREKQLEQSTANVEALQTDRVRMQKEKLVLSAQLEEAQASLASAIRDRAALESGLSDRIGKLEQRLQESELETKRERDGRLEAEARIRELQAVIDKLTEDLAGASGAGGMLKQRNQNLQAEVDAQKQRIQELQILLNSQQQTLDSLVGDAMGEVSKRERDWLYVRTQKDARIGELEERLRDVEERWREDREKAERLEAEFQRMDDLHRKQLLEMREKFEDELRRLRLAMEREKKDFQQRQAMLLIEAKEAKERDERQQKQINELLLQKAWLLKQVGLPEIDA